MKATASCIPYCTFVTCFKMMMHSSFDPFRNSREGEKQKKTKPSLLWSLVWKFRNFNRVIFWHKLVFQETFLPL